ncbi:MAG: sodium-dependent transporter [Endozoicomonadaceae bacterium]|nr:sodium-dependent transporter [Endozoicomonadaceae bacterium]
MADQQTAVLGVWAGRSTFILAAAGSAVGLGNLWKFSFVTGEYGGGAFVLVYLVCIALIGIPIMMAETALGRQGRQSPMASMRKLARGSDVSRHWSLLGWMGVLTGFLILSFYSVIAGWALAFTWDLGVGNLRGFTGEQVGTHFDALVADPVKLTGWHTLFMVLIALVVARGVHKGLESSVRVIMPLLLVLLIVLLGYSMIATDQFGRALSFLFSLNFSTLTWEAVLAAMGQSFFALSLGMGAIMVYGAYMPNDASIGSAVMTVAILNSVIALVVGMVIFPIALANGVEPSAGPRLLFVSLPAAFGQMPGGQIFGTLFFMLVSLAALSSSISLIEPLVAWTVERFLMSRVVAATIVSALIWLMGMGTVFSFNVWSGEEYQCFGMTVFELLDFVTAKIMLPLGGLLTAIFASWIMKRSVIYKALNLSLARFNLWRALCRVIIPVCVCVMFAVSLYKALT